jgi:hypothetical protein
MCNLQLTASDFETMFLIGQATGSAACYCRPFSQECPSPVLTLESIEWFIEGQPLSRSYDFAPRPPPPLPPLLSLNSAGEANELWEKATTCWRGWGGGGLGEEPSHTTREGLVLYKSPKTLWLTLSKTYCVMDKKSNRTSWLPWKMLNLP